MRRRRDYPPNHGRIDPAFVRCRSQSRSAASTPSICHVPMRADCVPGSGRGRSVWILSTMIWDLCRCEPVRCRRLERHPEQRCLDKRRRDRTHGHARMRLVEEIGLRRQLPGAVCRSRRSHRRARIVAPLHAAMPGRASIRCRPRTCPQRQARLASERLAACLLALLSRYARRGRLAGELALGSTVSRGRANRGGAQSSGSRRIPEHRDSRSDGHSTHRRIAVSNALLTLSPESVIPSIGRIGQARRERLRTSRLHRCGSYAMDLRPYRACLSRARLSAGTERWSRRVRRSRLARTRASASPVTRAIRQSGSSVAPIRS